MVLKMFLPFDKIKLSKKGHTFVKEYNMKLNEAFKIRLESILKEREETVYHFCKENGIGRSTIVNLMKGCAKSPTLSTLYQVSDALGLTSLEFLNNKIFCRDNIETD